MLLNIGKGLGSILLPTVMLVRVQCVLEEVLPYGCRDLNGRDPVRMGWGSGEGVRRVKPRHMSQGRSERACGYGLSSGLKRGGLAPECQVWREVDIDWSLCLRKEFEFLLCGQVLFHS